MQPANRPALRVRFVRFFVVGGATAVAYVGLVMALRWGGLNLNIATGIAVVVSAAVSYAGNHAWTFEAKGNHVYHLPRFLGVVAAGILLNQLLVLVLVDHLGWSYLTVLAAFLIAVPLLNFIAHNIYSFRRPRK